MSERRTWNPDLPRMTVVVLTYNRAATLPRALDSILAQTADAPDVEVVVVDDGSTDNTSTLLESYGARIRVLRQPHSGNCAGCRTAYLATRGEWFVFVDSDDALRPGALAALRAAAEAHKDAWLVLARTRLVGPQGHSEETRHMPLADDAMANFAAFAAGRFRALIAGGLIHRELLAVFDSPEFTGVHSADLAVLGTGLLKGARQIDAVTLDVHAHGARLRDDVHAIHASGLRLVGMLFDRPSLPPEAQRHRRRFTAFIELERTRAYHRSRWHSEAWRSFGRAAAAWPGALLSGRHVRRATLSLVRDLVGSPEGPVRRPPSGWRGHGPELWRDAIACLSGAAAHGPVALLSTRRPTYYLCEPADALHVLVGRAKFYHKTGIVKVDPILAGGLIGADLPVHLERRRALPVNFGTKGSNDFLAPAIETIVPRIEAWGSREIDVAIETQGMMAAAGGRFILGCPDEARMMELVGLLQKAHHYSIRELRSWYRWPGIPAPAWLPLKRRRRRAVELRKIDDWMQRVIDENKAAGDGSILSAIRRATPEGRQDVGTLRGVALMLFLAFMEPVSISLAWALELLAAHPEIQQRVAAEAAEVLRGAMPTSGHLAKLPYTGRVVSEVLRLYPNEWLLTRRATAADRLPSGALIRQGEEVMISPLLLARDARFFPEPERFDPERFAAGAATWPEGAYMPFGAGPRTCLGEHLAKRVLILALAAAAGRYRFVPVEGGAGVLESVNLFTSQPKESRMRVGVVRR